MIRNFKLNKNQLALFANGIYEKKSLKYVNDNLYAGWDLIKEWSKADSKVFIHSAKKLIVIAFRGTTNLKDVKDDISILLSTEHKNKRWQKARRLVEKVNDKYADEYKVYVVGHSLGGNLAEFATRHAGNKTVGFSRGNAKIGQKIKNKNYVDVYSKKDIISTLAQTSKGGKQKEVNTDWGLGAHRMGNFIKNDNIVKNKYI